MLIVLIDLLAGLFTAPYVFHVALMPLDDAGGNDNNNNATSLANETAGPVICTETWGGLRRTLYGAFTNVTQFVLPFTSGKKNRVL